ncbi:MAG: aspartate-semialdehyde dehydrogenase [Deltaproteobacteria bacterium]|nr:aspartate-semialdehyde dehydrogenase [Deltaproteobacteria bacterium]MBW1946749.1 aspartate-semialdehyde dehydrogenase [Deltaproteobacteria bacterium]MBW1966222.1 aspartate-semialdehyde dehydrogenase [Deltaproteobacteria bacterium]MBW2097231.1 aspartate-semialdehyde dehydrogenase [Deltaproteobacteria bacterium]
MAKTFNVAVAGATGAVGQTMIKVLEERDFPVGEIRFLASERSEGKELSFKAEKVRVRKLDHDSFDGVDIAIFSAGGDRSLTFAPSAAEAGAVVVDNSSAWRMDPEVPLVVPEVNPHAISGYKAKGIIANPNCSTIQMVVALKPLYDYARIKRVVVSTYQAVSGTGQKAIVELEDQVKSWAEGRTLEPKVYPHQIAFNCLPHIDVFMDNGYTREEMKMVNETRKIMEDPEIQVSATAVRVPVFYSHSEAVNVEFEQKISASKARELLTNAPGIKVIDDPFRNAYPLALEAEGQDLTLVGRIREDISQANGLDFWVVADNIRKGAATNAVQIAELLVEKYL